VRRQVTLGEVQVGPADAAREHPDPDLAGRRLRRLPVDGLERVPGDRTRFPHRPRTHGRHPPARDRRGPASWPSETREKVSAAGGRVGSVLVDVDLCYRALQSRDSRFDGWFYIAVTSTRIYCRPSCPAVTPKRANVRFYPSAAAAQTAGFRACKRCRPDATPGSPEWDVRADLVGRAMRLIGDGVVDREGVSGLARRLGFSERHVHRQLVAEVGAGPIAVARAQRAQTARVLLETTELAVSDVAFAAGFASIRQFNDTVREVFAVTPTELRRSRRHCPGGTPGTITVRLPFRAPIDLAGLFRFLAVRAVPGLEEWDGRAYRRSLVLPHGPGVVELSAGPPTGADRYVRCTLRLTDVRDLAVAVQRCRRLLDLDADPVAVAAALGADPVLRPLVAAAPGRRVPGHVDGAELAVRAVLGQQVTVAAARTLAARLTERYGTPLAAPVGSVTRLFPVPATLAAADLTGLGMPAARARAVGTLAAALASGDLVLDPGADRVDVRQRLLALPGIGEWTAAYVAMRALGDPDVFLPTDAGIRHALTRLALPAAPRAAAELAQRWRPWRSYALLLLWGTLDAPTDAPTNAPTDEE
jgi:AraC family transcriptional regulator of adaptative response / DNA-3-methyladenine glycosylase II